MDVLSDVLTATRSGASHSVRTTPGPRFAVSFPTERVAGFHVVLAGQASVRLDEPPAGEAEDGWHVLHAGDVVLLPHGAAHVLASEPGVAPVPLDHVGPALPQEGPLLLCGTHDLDASGSHPLLAGLPDLLVVRAEEGGASLRTALELLAGEVRSEPVGAPVARAALVDLVLVLLLRAQVASGAACRSGFGAALADAHLGPALRAVHADPGRAWTVAALAREATLSRSAFAERFRALVGEPPQAYVTRWRLDVAARLLRSSDAPLVTVARQVGYASPFAFSRAFTRAHGTAPGRYRRAPLTAAA